MWRRGRVSASGVAGVAAVLAACGGSERGATDGQPARDSTVAATSERLPQATSGGDEASARPPAVTCDDRAAPSLDRFDPARDTVRGPFAVVATARDVARRPASSFRPRRGRLQGAKLPVALRAGHRATLRVSPAQRADGALLFRSQTRDAARIADGDHAVTFAPCRPETPAFSGGTVVKSRDVV